MFRRISTKWVLSVLAVGVVPLVGFAWFVNVQMSERLWDVVRYYMQGIAADLAHKIDDEVHERQGDVAELSGELMVELAIEEGSGSPSAIDLRRRFENKVSENPKFDLFLIVDAAGRYVVSNELDFRGSMYSPALSQELRERDYRQSTWFQRAMLGETVLVDHHRSELVPPRDPSIEGAPENFHFGFAVPVIPPPPDDAVVGVPIPYDPRPVGVVYGVVNWGYIQYDVLEQNRGEYFQGLTQKDIYSSAYAWLWKADCDTVIGHPKHSLYNQSISRDVGLPDLVAAAKSADSGLYPEYVFAGVKKNAAFHHCVEVDQGGFGWVVGIGINNADIYGTINELLRILFRATLVVVGCVVLWTLWTARRTTRPIIELQRHTHKVAAGDLEAHLDVKSRDEIGDLAAAFNSMTEELKQSREVTVKAEKEAAWREMARQVAHEIKNPLTPISLSANLLLRARRENSPEFDDLFERTIDMIQRQVGNMRDIASDFSAFAGARNSSPEAVELGALLAQVVQFNGAWARELGVEISESNEGGTVFADRRELERVLINLVSNAFEAMPEGGELSTHVGVEGDDVVLSIRDTGVGLSPEVRARLFEPYFTTRSHGTGLGLAICKRVIDELGGSIELVPADDGKGTVARVRIPRYEAE